MQIGAVATLKKGPPRPRKRRPVALEKEANEKQTHDISRLFAKLSTDDCQALFYDFK